jgi:peptide/nickel transport system permease protein
MAAPHDRQRRLVELQVFDHDDDGAAATFFIVAVRSCRRCWPAHSRSTRQRSASATGLKPPVLLSSDGDWTFPLGTDDQGRDVLSSIMYGTRPVADRRLRLGGRGHGAGHRARPGQRLFRRTIDAVIMRIADVQLTFPAIWWRC